VTFLLHQFITSSQCTDKQSN